MPAANHKTRLFPLLITAVALISMAAPVLALTPGEVLVVANRNAAKSAGLAKFYMKQRGIPGENLVLLWVTDKETCTREAYNKKVLPPVKRFLAAHPHIRAMVTIYGLPIRIKSRSNDSPKGVTGAAFDSELMLAPHTDYDLGHWQPNPFYLGFRNTRPPIPQDHVIMVSRLDGPSPDIVKRMIRDGLAAEKKGLGGKAYFDARWPEPPKGKKLRGYAFYDSSLHKTARDLKKTGIPVVLDQTKALFRPGKAPDTALYCGWYSLGNYIDAFKWNPGSLGYHMASSECTTLKGKGNTWCKRILENGAAATLGPVAEPYIQAFPVPEIFFKLLTKGGLTLAEAYLASLPYLSWQMMLVGDPLYRINLIEGGG